MADLKEFRDERVRFIYPAHYRFQAVLGQYFLRESKNKAMLLSVTSKSEMNGLFEKMAGGASPDPVHKVKAMHERYVIGNIAGRAIIWDLFRPNATPFMRVLEFFFEMGDFAALAKLDVRSPADPSELEAIVASV